MGGTKIHQTKNDLASLFTHMKRDSGSQTPCKSELRNPKPIFSPHKCLQKALWTGGDSVATQWLSFWWSELRFQGLEREIST